MRSISLVLVNQVIVTSLLAGSLALLSAPARAQNYRIAPDARGYQTTMQLMQQRAAASPSIPQTVTRTPVYRPAPSAMQVIVQAPVRTEGARSAPAVPAPYSIAIRGPDGELRRYPVEGGPSSVVVRQYTVQPGQAITVYVNPPAAAPRR